MSDFGGREDGLPVAKPRRRLTRIDQLALGAAFLTMFLLLLPVYFSLRERRYFQTCQQNIRQMGSALGLYIEDNQGLPSAYPDQIGAPPNWMLAFYGYVKKENSSGGSVFTCPSARAEENTRVTNVGPGPIVLSYGYYIGVSGARYTDIEQRGETAVIADSVRGGINGSYNPLPFIDKNDGFLLGYNDSNSELTPNSQYVTRLAIYGREGVPPEEAELTGRHSGRVSVLYADGHAGSIPAERMFISRDRQTGQVRAPWLLPNRPDPKPPVNP